MAERLRVGPKHHADTYDDAVAAARTWLDEHRPEAVYDRARLPYSIHVQPDVRGRKEDDPLRWVAHVRADWTPDPAPSRRARDWHTEGTPCTTTRS
jgi:hypothetical protein